MRIADLPSPRAVVDLDRMESNCRAMAARAQWLGVRLRPHVKTHKTVEGAMVQHGGALGPVTVSTLAEARLLADAGFSDVTYAVPIEPSKFAAAADVARRLEHLALLVDHDDAAAALGRFAAGAGVRLGVFVKVDCGGRRSGVDPNGVEGARLAARLSGAANLDFRGVLTHAGQAYACRTREEARAVAAVERDVTVGFARALESRGVRVGEVSVGSTPTMCAVDDLAGVTEIRPGNYAFFDAFQAAIGSCTLADCAFTVLTRVVGSSPARREAVIDAGALALSKDPGPVHVDPAFGFGVVLDVEGNHVPGWRVASLSQEHGVLRVPEGATLPGIGAPLRIVPNHSCLAAALHPSYAVARGGDVVGEWWPARGW